MILAVLFNALDARANAASLDGHGAAYPFIKPGMPGATKADNAIGMAIVGKSFTVAPAPTYPDITPKIPTEIFPAVPTVPY